MLVLVRPLAVGLAEAEAEAGVRLPPGWRENAEEQRGDNTKREPQMMTVKVRQPREGQELLHTGARRAVVVLVATATATREKNRGIEAA